MFSIILIFMILIFLCFWIPYKSGKKNAGIIMSIFLLVITILGICIAYGYFLGFAFLIVIAISVVFITYWGLRYYKKKRLATILAIVFSIFFLYVALSPWIDDWMFTGNNAKKILKKQGFVLNDRIQILSNESGGFRDYYSQFVISLSKNDYEKIKTKIISTPNYLGTKEDDCLGQPNYSKKNDIISYENNYNYNWIRCSSKDAYWRITIQLDKRDSTLNFIEEV